ncbi:MAG: pyrroline-5-carboxylate reductase [Bacillaceae bacterium]|nr:pyrroline-5-carboxylate reductase [Bacillaceae bacterium]
MLENQKICFVGAGSMAEAIISGLISRKTVKPEQIMMTNRSDDERLQMLHNRYGVQTEKNKRNAIDSCDLIILAMKPKDVKDALSDIGDLVRPDQLVISVLAGISIDFIQKHLSGNIPIIRSMPNTSSQVGMSATGMAAGAYATSQHIEQAKKIFAAIGSVCLVEEKDLDTVTGLSGSGPAYIYYLVEAMEEAAQKEGLSPETARALTVQTLLGAAHMLQSSDEEPATLREKVTSPGGTTMAGLETLDAFRFQEAIIAAIRRAAERSRELGELAEGKVKLK